MAGPTKDPSDIWQKAVDSLDPHVVKGLDPAKTGVRDILTAVHRVAQAKREDSLKKRWRFSGRGKQDIIVRDVLEKIVYWIDRFKDAGDNAVQYDPAHAALPWAAVRFILQAVVNYTAVEREILEEIELVTRLLASFREAEKIYIGADVLPELQDALVHAYAAILDTLAKAVKYLSESKKIRSLKAPFRLAGDENLRRLLVKEQQVLRYTNLVDGKRLLNISTRFDRTAELSAIADKTVDEQKYKEILDWLSRTRYLEHHADQRDLRSTGTGTWILHHAEYVSWQQKSACSTLLVHGIPGCGKTILCSLIIDESTSTPGQIKAPLAFFYCTASKSEPDRRNTASVIRSLVRQLTSAVSRYPKIHSAVLAVYETKVEEAKLNGFDLAPIQPHECEDLILAALEDNPATIIIDALDEMDDPQTLMAFLETIITKSKNIVKVMVTARDGTFIDWKISPSHDIRITPSSNHHDVEQFVTKGVDELVSRRNLSQDARDSLVAGLVAGAGEMFQWAKLQLSQLEASEQLIVEQDLSQQLSNFSVSTLDELYGSIFDVLLRSARVTRQLIINAFSWLLYSQEPLEIDAFLAVIAMSANWEQPSPDALVRICRGFIYIDSQSGVFRLVHQSVRAFLGVQPLFTPHEAHSLISLNCLQIFNQPPFENLTHLRPAENPYDYALLYFGVHLSALDPQLVLPNMVQSLENFLFDCEDAGLYTKIWLEAVGSTFDFLPRGHSQKQAMDAIANELSSPLFPICAFGMDYILENHTWPSTYDWGQQNNSGCTALYVAAHFGHTPIVKFLLDRHVEPNIKCGRLGTAIQCAAFRGHCKVVQTLLEHGADPRIHGQYRSALHAACMGNRERVVILLLERGFDIHTQDDYDSIEFELAKTGFAEALTKLQKHHFNKLTAINRSRQFACNAIASGEVNGLLYLLRKFPAADVIQQGSLATSALHGHEQMSKILLDRGLDVDEVGELGTPLRCASTKGHNNICNLLLDNGADVNGNGQFGSALHAAAMRGHLHTAKLLLNSGADANLQGGHYGTALQAAAYQGHIDLVRLLLTVGANVHGAGFSKDAIHAAVEGGQQEVLQLLLDAGFRPARPIPKGSYLSIWEPSPRPRHILRSVSSEWNLPHRTGSHGSYRTLAISTPVSSDRLDPTADAIAYTSVSIERASFEENTTNYLLETCAALDNRAILSEILSEKDCCGESKSAIQDALTVACRAGNTSVVEEILLLRYRPDVDLDGALHDAAAGGHNSIVTILLNHLAAHEIGRDHFWDVLSTSIPHSPNAFKETMQRMKLVLSQSDIHCILAGCFMYLLDTDWQDIVQIVLEELPARSGRELVNAFKKACMTNKIAVASVIYSSLRRGQMSTRQLIRQMRLAVQEGHSEILRFLLDKTEDTEIEEHLDGMICLAAGNGSLKVLSVLLAWDEAAYPRDSVVLVSALNAAACNGHKEICANLISQGANPLRTAPMPQWADLTIRRNKALPYRSGSGRRRMPPHAPQYNIHQLEAIVESSDSEDSLCDPVERESRSTTRNAIASCLTGFQRFTKKKPEHEARCLVYHEATWYTKDEIAQYNTLRHLLENVISFEDLDLTQEICDAVEICPPDVIALLLEKSTSAHSVASPVRTKIIMERVITRECLTRSAMQVLIDVEASNVLNDDDTRQLLVGTLTHFEERVAFYGAELFPATCSLQDVFTDGPGAMVQYLLARLPGEEASRKQYGLVLQMAAAAGQLDLIKMLIAHNIDVNATTSYYGTALQAASRFGHLGTVEALLEAGADTDITQGEYHTALRAAVMSGSLPTVQLLLNYQADPELAPAPTQYSRSESDELQSTALCLAIHEERAAIAHCLLDAGASIAPTHGRTSSHALLVKACVWGETSIVRRLLTSGICLEMTCQVADYQLAQKSALHAAIHHGHLDIIRLLLTSGFDLSADRGVDDLLAFAVNTENLAVVDALMQHVSDRCDNLFEKACKAAINHGLLDVLENLLELAPDAMVSEALPGFCKIACTTPHYSMVEFLFERACHFHVLEANLPTLFDIREIRVENFEVFLDYMPFTIDFFVEACIRGNISLVRRGLDCGHTPNQEDKLRRSGLHFACAQGRVAVVELLLERGANVNHRHPIYGDIVVFTLEGLLAKKLMLRAEDEGDVSYAKDLVQLDHVRLSHFLSVEGPADEKYLETWSSRPFQPRVPHQKTTFDYEETINLLVSTGAQVDDAMGRFGTALTLAAFGGLDRTFDVLTDHGASVNASGRALRSPLLAAIAEDRINVVEKVLSIMKGSKSISQFDSFALHKACETGNLNIAQLLLKHGFDSMLRDDYGRTALQIRLGVIDEQRSLWMKEDSIVRLLMDARRTMPFSVDEMDVAASLTYTTMRDGIVSKMAASLKEAGFSDEANIRLLPTSSAKTYCEDDGHREQVIELIGPITPSMLAAANDTETMELLLDQDPTYIITPETLDKVADPRSSYPRSRIEILLLRNPSCVLTEAHICRLLASGHNERSWREDTGLPTPLDLTFSRKPDQEVTEAMLRIVRDPNDLRFLLARVEPRKPIVTDLVLEALTPAHGPGKKAHREELLCMFLQFQPSAKVSRKVSRSFFTDGHLDTIECLLDHRTDICLFAEDVSVIVARLAIHCCQDIWYDMERALHCNLRRFIKILSKHPGQYSLSDEVRSTVEFSLLRQGKTDHMSIFYEFAGWRTTWSNAEQGY